MLFADLTAEGWAIIVGAIALGIGGIVTPIVGQVLAFYRERAKVAREQELEDRNERRERDRIERERLTALQVSREVKQVSETLKHDTEKREAHAQIRDKKLDALTEKSEVIAAQTNGMLDVIKDASFLAGQRSATDKAAGSTVAKEVHEIHEVVVPDK